MLAPLWLELRLYHLPNLILCIIHAAEVCKTFVWHIGCHPLRYRLRRLINNGNSGPTQFRTFPKQKYPEE